MQIVFALVALVVGFVLLVKGADWFVEGSAGIANKFGIPQIVIGRNLADYNHLFQGIHGG